MRATGTRSKMFRDSKYALKVWTLMALMAVVITVFVLQPPLPQDPTYHDFADKRVCFGVPNFADVVSNVAFAFVGAYGTLCVALWSKYASPPLQGRPSERLAYLVFFLSMGLVAWGSGYYHLNPNNETLLWDRLPMTLGFMSLFIIMLSERINPTIGKFLLLPLLFVGAVSVHYWYVTESMGVGDLRPYAVVQFGPIICTPLLLLWFPSRYSHGNYFWAVLLLYLLAKIAEVLDRPIFTLTYTFVSGHTLKHWLAAMSCALVALQLHVRHRIGHPE